jgi:DNA-binding transcriptional LysR family regulator
MDLKQLRSFMTVANTLNFGRAARQLHLSQSALSIQIQNLEAHLGVSLYPIRPFRRLFVASPAR